jgi:hypothetical protein
VEEHEDLEGIPGAVITGDDIEIIGRREGDERVRSKEDAGRPWRCRQGTTARSMGGKRTEEKGKKNSVPCC